MSKYDTNSMFPQQIDPLIFFSDIRLEHEIALGAYKTLIEEKRYDEAIDYLEEHAEVDAYCADLFNMLINRTKAVQRYANGEYIPPATSNPLIIENSVTNDISGYNGRNVICVSGESIDN